MSNLPKESDVKAKDPGDYNYVSKKNWLRKQNIIKGNDAIANFIGRPGPVTGFIIAIVDTIVTLMLKFFLNLFTICTKGFQWLYNILFGNFKGIIPSSVSGGAVVSMRFFRYLMTVIMPPFGILLSKGLYGWFSILVCIIITYVNYLAGIIYAFVLTARNRYADQYEFKSVNDALADKDNQTLTAAVVDSGALMGTCGFIIMLGLTFYLILSFF
jgi:uncharacterized membrane protein YqaE (UPF0057 family)